MTWFLPPGKNVSQRDCHLSSLNKEGINQPGWAAWSTEQDSKNCWVLISYQPGRKREWWWLPDMSTGLTHQKRALRRDSCWSLGFSTARMTWFSKTPASWFQFRSPPVRQLTPPILFCWCIPQLHSGVHPPYAAPPWKGANHDWNKPVIPSPGGNHDWIKPIKVVTFPLPMVSFQIAMRLKPGLLDQIGKFSGTSHREAPLFLTRLPLPVPSLIVGFSWP